MGEVVHGDYTHWANPQCLNSVTNYECYKSLYSSHVDKNYFEIAYSLNRQFGPAGLYRNLGLYNFADNHDVNRIASNLQNPAHLYPLYCLLFSIPGIPAIYYGSEWGLRGLRNHNDDSALRPQLDLAGMQDNAPHPALPDIIQKLAQIRKGSTALRHGDYSQLQVTDQQLAFARQCQNETVVVLVNAAAESASFDLPVGLADGTPMVDLLNNGEVFQTSKGKLRVETVHPHWARILTTG
jgi:glycosidase